MQSNTGKLGDARNSCCPKWKLQPATSGSEPAASGASETWHLCQLFKKDLLEKGWRSVTDSQTFMAVRRKVFFFFFC